MAVEKDASIARAQANAASNKTLPYNPMSGNTPDVPKPAPYNPISGNTPDVPKAPAYNPLNSNMYVAASGSSTGTTVQGAPGYVTPQGPSNGNTGGNTGNNTGNATGSTTGPAGKTIASSSRNADGTWSVLYTDGTTATIGTQIANTQTAAQTADRQNIFDQVTGLFTTYGVLKAGDPASDALMKTIKDLAMSGAGSDTISLQLQQSDAYKARFAGNETRKAAGLNVLSPAEYIATENAYDQILHAAGVPTGFYTNSAEKAKLIGADVSAAELQTRVDLASKSIQNADPYYTEQLKGYYGLSQGDMIAHVLDPSVAAPLIQQQVNTATIGAAAARNATNVNLTTAQQLAGMGITQAQAEQGFGNIAQQLPAMQQLASRYQGFGKAGQVGQELQSATFGAPIGGETPAQAEARLKRLQAQEVGSFSGSSGAGKGTLMGSEEGLQ
jgi:hypothetical protein